MRKRRGLAAFTMTMLVGGLAAGGAVIPATSAGAAADGNITTIVGNGSHTTSGNGGAATAAGMEAPNGVAYDAAGNLYVSDQNQNVVRKVSPSGIITAFAGTAGPFGSFGGDGGPATSADLRLPSGLAIDAAGNVFIADAFNFRIRKVTPAGVITTVAGDGTNATTGDGGPAALAEIGIPIGLTFDGSGRLLIADANQHRVRRIATDGTISTVAGTGTLGFAGDGGPATSAQLDAPQGVAVDSHQNILVTDYNNERVRRIDHFTGVITTIAGTGAATTTGNGGPATVATLHSPYGITVDAADNVFVSEFDGNVVRRIATNGIISTVAGNGTNPYTGDNQPATSTGLFARGLAIDSSLNLNVADNFNSRVYKIQGLAQPAFPQGYYLAASDGGVFTHGSGVFYGSEGGLKLVKPIVTMAATPTHNGYWLFASDGGVFTHGDAGFFGSEGALKLTQPIVAAATTPSGEGYWLFASDGGVFTHGDATYYGSEGALKLAQPIVSAAASPSGFGYWLFASDGGVFTHGDAKFYGSEGALKLAKPIVASAATPSG